MRENFRNEEISTWQSVIGALWVKCQSITELEAVVDDFREIVALVEKEEGVEK